MKIFPPIAELPTFVKTFPSERSCGSRTLPLHYPQSRVAELLEDTPLNSVIVEVELHKTFPSKRKQKVHEDISLNSGMRELCEDIPF